MMRMGGGWVEAGGAEEPDMSLPSAPHLHFMRGCSSGGGHQRVEACASGGATVSSDGQREQTATGDNNQTTETG